MKKCPSCGKEFEDSMKFCQLDGTPLVDDAPAFDPYATIVSTPANTITPPADITPAADDPMKTMMVSDGEMKEALGETESELATAADTTASEVPMMPTPPEVITPEVEEPAAPTFGNAGSPPPSPFSTSEPAPSPYDEPATIIQPQGAPFEPPPPVQEWTPPPAPVASWQDQQIGSNTPFQPPVVGADGANKTLPIVSLVLGILSICCPLGAILGPAALIVGFLSIKNINSDPAIYGGKGLAIAGMITGGVFFVLSILWWILQVIGIGLQGLGSM